MASDGLPRKILLEDIDDSIVAQSDLAPEVVTALTRLAAAGQGAEKISTDPFDVFAEHLAQPPTAVIFGAGHLSYHIARMARDVHFKIVVCDDREEFANRERFPDADEVVVADFERVLDHVRIDARSYAVIVTRGHRCDEIVLDQVLRTDARYIGMIGSKRKTRTILDKLTQKGFSRRALDRVYSPIGLAIGAVTPEEIALSVVSELVKMRRLGRTSLASHMTLTGTGGEA
jgi:xanthine dehydrogenase accessory factor